MIFVSDVVNANLPFKFLDDSLESSSSWYLGMALKLCERVTLAIRTLHRGCNTINKLMLWWRTGYSGFKT